MSIGVTVNGTFHLLPGVYPIVDASDLVAAEQGGQGILGIVGIGTGVLEPKKVHHVTPNLGVLARQYVAGSEILTAARLAIDPSGQVPGVTNLYLITANPATQATLTLQDTNSLNVVGLRSHGYGAHFNTITAQVDNAAKELTLAFGTGAEQVTEIFNYGTGAGTLAALVADINDRSALASATLVAAGAENLKTLVATPFAGASDGIVGGTKASRTLKDNSAVDVLKLDTKGIGTGMNATTVAVDNATKKVTITQAGTQEIFTYGTGAGSIAALASLMNSTSGLVSATFLAAGDESLLTMVAAPFSGGTAPAAPTLQDYQDCLDQLGGTNIQLVMLASSMQAAQVALADHCETNKRIGFCGYDLQSNWGQTAQRDTNIANLQNRAASIGSPAVLFSGVGTDGLPSYLAVAKYAGIAAGVAPSVPLNNKDLKTTVAEAELSVEEAEDLLAAGVSPPFRRQNPQRPGFVIADGLSTYTADDNLYNRIVSVRRAADGMNQDIIYELEGYLGNEGTEVTVGRVINAVDRRLRRATLPSSTLRIAGYDRNSISATFESTVLRVYYSFTPIQPIRYIVPIASLKATVIEQTIEIPLGQ